jgi:protein tyrosine/serine phosphatase
MGSAHRSEPKDQPLKDSTGRPLLQDAFEHIEADYGSVSNYLVRELGVSAKDLAKLRTLYLE